MDNTQRTTASLLEMRQSKKGIKLESTFHKTLIIHSMEQRTPEWDEVRRRKITASRMELVKSSGEGRQDYMLQLILDRKSGKIQENNGYVSEHMVMGRKYEPVARAFHALTQGIKIREVGFVEASLDIGFSPDGAIGRSGLLEVKCRIPKVQLKIILGGRMPPEDRWQVQFSLWAGKKKYCDYVSFCPFLDDPNEKYFYRKIERNEPLIAGIRSEVVRFLNEMKQTESALRGEQYMGELFT